MRFSGLRHSGDFDDGLRLGRLRGRIGEHWGYADRFARLRMPHQHEDRAAHTAEPCLVPLSSLLSHSFCPTEKKDGLVCCFLFLGRSVYWTGN